MIRSYYLLIISASTHHLRMMALLCNNGTAYEYGIQYNTVTRSSLSNYGCTTCYETQYSAVTTAIIIDQCTGPILFVGASRPWDSTFPLGAYGLSSEIHIRTELNKPHLSNGVKWYFTPGESFGFLDSRASLNQLSADYQGNYSDSRLSWHLDNYTGGYRAGANVDLNRDTTFRKSIYNCPNFEFGNGSMSPSPMPTPSLPTAPSLWNSSYPTTKPTPSQNFGPSPRPSLQPTPKPTISPTPRPTLQPTHRPLSQPTSRPSSRPTSTPTSTPTAQPTSTRDIEIDNAIRNSFGIQYSSVTMSDLMRFGCSVCYAVTYDMVTNDTDIDQCTGPILFVGASRPWDSTFLLGAYGLSSEIHIRTELNKPHLSNGVKWYFTPGKSFGFLDSRASLNQLSADYQGNYSDSRLSWHLDNYSGGYRAGAYVDLNRDTTFRKSIYNCPGKSNW